MTDLMFMERNSYSDQLAYKLDEITNESRVYSKQQDL